jgi:hypothetical protein
LSTFTPSTPALAKAEWYRSKNSERLAAEGRPTSAPQYSLLPVGKCARISGDCARAVVEKRRFVEAPPIAVDGVPNQQGLHLEIVFREGGGAAQPSGKLFVRVEAREALFAAGHFFGALPAVVQNQKPRLDAAAPERRQPLVHSLV